jgi:hypothetical protein
MKLPLSLAIVFFFLAASFSDSAQAESSTSQETTSQPSPVLNQDRLRIADIDHKLLERSLEIERFIIHFQQASNRHQWWRLWLYPIAQESGTASSFSSTLVSLSQRARGLSNPDLISTPSLKRGTSANLVGKTINGSSSAFELTQNTLVMWHARQMGFSPRRSVAYMKDSLAQMDDLLAQRESTVKTLPPGRTRDVREVEGRLMRQIRDQMVFEFFKWSVHSRETAWKENSFYAIDALQNYTASTGAILALKGFSDPASRGAAILTTLAANSMAAMNPIIRTQIGLYVRKYQKRRLAKDFPSVRPQLTNKLLPSWADLDSLSAENDSEGRSLREVAFLAQSCQRIDNTLTHQVDTIQKLRRVAIQQEISGPLIGTAAVSRSVIEVVAHFGYGSNRVTATRLNFAGAFPQAAGQSYSLMNTPTTAIASLLHYRKLVRNNESPEQILEARLARLDRVESEFPSVAR